MEKNVLKYVFLLIVIFIILVILYHIWNRNIHCLNLHNYVSLLDTIEYRICKYIWSGCILDSLIENLQLITCPGYPSRVPVQVPDTRVCRTLCRPGCPQQVFQLAHTPPADRYTINNITDRSRCKARVMNRPYTVQLKTTINFEKSSDHSWARSTRG